MVLLAASTSTQTGNSRYLARDDGALPFAHLNDLSGVQFSE
jgi:hypothetical protein